MSIKSFAQVALNTPPLDHGLIGAYLARDLPGTPVLNATSLQGNHATFLFSMQGDDTQPVTQMMVDITRKHSLTIQSAGTHDGIINGQPTQKRMGLTSILIRNALDLCDLYDISQINVSAGSTDGLAFWSSKGFGLTQANGPETWTIFDRAKVMLDLLAEENALPDTVLTDALKVINGPRDHFYNYRIAHIPHTVDGTPIGAHLLPQPDEAVSLGITLNDAAAAPYVAHMRNRGDTYAAQLKSRGFAPTKTP